MRELRIAPQEKKTFVKTVCSVVDRARKGHRLSVAQVDGGAVAKEARIAAGMRRGSKPRCSAVAATRPEAARSTESKFGTRGRFSTETMPKTPFSTLANT